MIVKFSIYNSAYHLKLGGCKFCYKFFFLNFLAAWLHVLRRLRTNSLSGNKSLFFRSVDRTKGLRIILLNIGMKLKNFMHSMYEWNFVTRKRLLGRFACKLFPKCRISLSVFAFGPTQTSFFHLNVVM